MSKRENQRFNGFDPNYLVPGLPFYEGVGHNASEAAGNVVEFLLELPARIGRVCRRAGADGEKAPPAAHG